MKELIKYNRVSGYLNTIFNKLNASYFNNQLETPVITIQSTPKAYGHVSVNEVWLAGEDSRRELNIGAGTLDRPIENIVATMLHEMVHLYCLQNNIKETSNKGVYHNKNFKREGEKRGLILEYNNMRGYSITQPSDSLVEWCIDNGLEEIKITRLDPLSAYITPTGGEKAGSNTNTLIIKKPSNTRKYACPCCGNSVRATKEVNIICGDCNQKMILC